MLDKDTEKYLKGFKESDFSSYNFLSMFCALNFIKDNKYFDRNKLLSFIEKNKNLGLYDKLLNDIKIKNNGVFPYSDNLEEAYSILKWANILYTISPEEDAKIYIKDDIPLNDIITFKNEYYSLMETFVNDYNKFINESEKTLKKEQK